MSEYHDYKLFKDEGGFTVKGYGEHPRHSVNYGMTRIVFLDAFDTEAEARKAYPQLAGDGSEWGSKFLDADLTRQPSTAPSWFDPAIAGERWEDDY